MPDIGATLREARMARRLDITEVEAATKIRAKYLRALENEEWDLLPGPTFVRTFLRTYGDYLELDSRMLVEEYKQSFQRPSQQDLLPFGGGGGGGRPSRRQQRSGRGIPPFALVGLVVVVLLGVLWALGTIGGGGSDDDARTSATPTPTADTSAAQKRRAAREREADRARRRREAAAERKRNAVVRFQAIASGEVEVCLESGTTGRTIIDAQVLGAGERTRTVSAKRLLVRFGNSQVRMRVNGKTVTVPASDVPIGYDLRAGQKPRRLDADAQPSCS